MKNASGPRALGRAALLVGVGLIVGVAGGWLLFAPQQGSRDEAPSIPAIWFEDLGDPPRLDDAAEAALLRALAARLIDGQQGTLDLPGSVINDESPRLVFLSLGDGTSRARVVMGAGRGLGTAIRDAVARAAPLCSEGRAFRLLTLDVVETVEDLGAIRPDGPVRFVRGVHGLALQREAATAFLPPEVLANGLVDARSALRAGRLLNAMEATGRPHRVRVDAAFERGAVEAFRFTTRSLHWAGGSAVRVLCGRRMPDGLDAAMLLDAARAGGAYLARNVAPNGRFVYAYWPSVDEEDDDYNILRHAGTTYSMLEVQEAAPDEALFAAASRALSYLVRSTAPGADEGTALVVERGEAKLGGNGLAAIALAKYIQLTGDDTHKPLLLELGRWIESVQAKSGEFEIHKMSWPGAHVMDFVSTYYPGEALLALARIHAVDPEPHWLDAAERGARWLIEVRDGKLEMAALPHDHWLLYALNEIHAARPKPLYERHAMRIAEAILDAQNLDPHRPDWLGSYYQPPRSTPTATRGEGLGAAWHLATRVGEEGLSKRIIEGIERGVRFQWQTQFRPESALHLADPQRVLGGFHRSLTEYEIRIDYVQHNISALLGLRRILR